jgi:hypothetical protein
MIDTFVTDHEPDESVQKSLDTADVTVLLGKQ